MICHQDFEIPYTIRNPEMPQNLTVRYQQVFKMQIMSYQTTWSLTPNCTNFCNLQPWNLGRLGVVVCD